MTIQYGDPFATPEEQRSPVRRLRGRLVAPVTLWTTPGPAGLTVSSTMVVDGEPGRVLGLIDEESALWEALQHSEVFTIAPLTPQHQELADRFAGLAPAPGGLFAQGERWQQTAYGPVLAEASTWAGCQLVDARPCGWSLLVEGVVATVELPGAPEPLAHYRGRYRRLSQ